MVDGQVSGAQSERRIAALDVGTNSLRLIVAEASPDGSYRVIDDEKVIVRLGQGLATTGRLAEDRIEAAAEAIDHLRDIAQGYQVEELRAVATAAVREAPNGPDLVAVVRDRSGVELRVISAAEEARLSYRSVDNAFSIRHRNTVIADIGGGSTEILLSVGGVVDRVYLLKLGAVRLTEMFGPCETEEQFEMMRSYVRDHLKEHVDRPPFGADLMFGTGGTFTAVAGMSMNRGTSRSESGDLLPFSVRGYELQRSDVRHMLDWLRKMSVRQRSNIPGLSPDRAEIIVAGVLIADRVMSRLGVNRLQTHDGGIRDGLLLTMIDEIFSLDRSSPSRPELDRLQEVRRFAVKCNYESRDAEHVATLALSVFDQLAVQRGEPDEDLFTAENRELLEAAAILRDVGYLVNYARHHKHSYHLIIHSGLRGFTSRELSIVANVARYHRRALPKTKHASFAKLPPEDQKIVSGLAAILRVADGLDRTHTQTVEGVRVQLAEDHAAFAIDANERPNVNIWGAKRKAKLFHNFFGLEPRFEWSGAGHNGQHTEGGDAHRLPTPKQSDAT